MKIFKPKKDLKNSKEVFEFFKEKKADKGIIPYKGGTAIVLNRRVKEIFVGKDSLEKAKKKTKK